IVWSRISNQSSYVSGGILLACHFVIFRKKIEASGMGSIACRYVVHHCEFALYCGSLATKRTIHLWRQWKAGLCQHGEPERPAKTLAGRNYWRRNTKAYD